MKQKLYTYTFTVDTSYFDDGEPLIIKRKLPYSCDMEAVIDDIAREATTIYMGHMRCVMSFNEIYSSLNIAVHREDK